MRLTEEGKDRLPDLKRFGSHLVSSKDIDPLYPVLQYLQRDMDEEQALWHSFLYVAWYNLPSAMTAFEIAPHPHRRLLKRIDAKWPTGVERRANRGGRVGLHIAAYLHAVDIPEKDQFSWYMEGIDADVDPEDNWRVLNTRLQSVYGNGRWAAYKHLEVLRRVNGLPVAAPDMGHQFSSGPREGLAMLYGELEGQGKEIIAELDARGLDLQRRLAKRGLEVDIEELETILCNWKSLVKGKYYVGHDIDEFQEQIELAWKERKTITEEVAQQLWEARYETLPYEYLGEHHERHGVDKKRMAAYRDRRKILIRKAS